MSHLDGELVTSYHGPHALMANNLLKKGQLAVDSIQIRMACLVLAP